MYSSVKSGAVHGVEGAIISVEADVSDGLPMFSLVGLLSSEVREAGDRVRNALRNSGMRMPPKRITINLSPADIKKSGAAFDLAIAVAILCGMGQLEQMQCEPYLFLGELGLDGSLKPVKGVLAIVDTARQQGITTCVVPVQNIAEARLVDGVCVLGAEHLRDVIAYFIQGIPLLTESEMEPLPDTSPAMDFSDVKGQALLKRAVMIAAAGMHNLLIGGPPGAGKSMIAKRIPGILPELTYQESMELTKIYSVCGLLKEPGALLKQRPFRAPHHTISHSALVGGGAVPKPGEISLAHCGVLFLDELPEFQRSVIEVLRQPLEEHRVTISRVHASYTFPADFMLVAAMNMCPCGCYPDTNRCVCTPMARQRYRNRISQPILDRMDIQVMAKDIRYDDLYGVKDSGQELDSRTIRIRIAAAHRRQWERYRTAGILFNSQLEGGLLYKTCALNQPGAALLKTAHDKLNLSARASQRVLKVARSIADLEESETIKEEHLMEALSFREMEGMHG